MTPSNKRHRIRPGCLVLFFVQAALAGPALAAETTDVAAGQGLAARGGANGVTACSACHGASGEGQPATGIPRLAGFDAAYLTAQLVAFGNGTRKNATMTPIVQTMDPDAIRETAAYYASLSVAPGAGAAPKSPQVAAGEEIAMRGDWSANIPPCASCHGTRGLGVGAAFPPVAGQSAAYMANQLRAWKTGTRHGDPIGLMRTIAAHLNDTQIAAVAAYYESLVAAPPARPAEEAKP